MGAWLGSLTRLLAPWGQGPEHIFLSCPRVLSFSSLSHYNQQRSPSLWRFLRVQAKVKGALGGFLPHSSISHFNQVLYSRIYCSALTREWPAWRELRALARLAAIFPEGVLCGSHQKTQPCALVFCSTVHFLTGAKCPSWSLVEFDQSVESMARLPSVLHINQLLNGILNW